MSAIISSWGNLGAAGVLAIVVIGIFTGRLVPRRVYKDMEGQRDKWEGIATRLQEREAELYASRMAANTEALAAVQQSFNTILQNRGSSKEIEHGQ